MNPPGGQSDRQQADGNVVVEVVEVVRSVAPGAPPAAIELDSSLREMGFDSVDLIELTVRLEKHFHLTLVDPDSYAVRTVSDVVALVEGSRSGTDAAGDER